MNRESRVSKLQHYHERRSTRGYGGRQSNLTDDYSFWTAFDTAEWEQSSGPNSRTKREQVLNEMKRCSQCMLVLAIISIVLGVVDIETQYHQTTSEKLAADSKCLIQTQKHARQVNSLSHSSYWLLQSIRLMVSITSILNILLLITYHKLEKNLVDLKQKLAPTSWMRFLMLLAVEWPTTWPRLSFWLTIAITSIHVPPFIDPKVYAAELQLVIFARIVCILKFCKHNHPMHITSITEMVSSISPIDLEESDFLLKTYFVKFPLTTLFVIYNYLVFVLGYVVFVLERTYGAYKTYLECVWLVSVTLPNTGFGDQTPKSVPCRIMIAMTGLIGVLQTGLIVASLHVMLSLNREEAKILRFVDLHNVNRNYTNAAARIIQTRWRMYSFRKRHWMFCSLNITKLFVNCGFCSKLEHYNMLNVLTQQYNNAWRQWRKIKEKKRIHDGLFFNEFLTNTPEIARADIMSQVEGISQFFGVIRQTQEVAEDDLVGVKIREVHCLLAELQNLRKT